MKGGETPGFYTLSVRSRVNGEGNNTCYIPFGFLDLVIRPRARECGPRADGNDSSRRCLLLGCEIDVYRKILCLKRRMRKSGSFAMLCTMDERRIFNS
jgi:hypothetical protein